MKYSSLKYSGSETKILSLGDIRVRIGPNMWSPRLLLTGRVKIGWRRPPFKGGGGSGGGGVRRRVESTRKGSPGSDWRGTAPAVWQRPVAVRPWRARAARRVLTTGRRRVTDEWGLAGSGSGQAERGARRVGRPGKETGWAEPGWTVTLGIYSN
jgi:hypothetical protein